MNSGIYIPGDGKALIKLKGSDNNYLIAASQNKGALKLFELKQKKQFVKVNVDDRYAIIHFKNGKIQKEEFYYGTGFLSQSSRYCVVDENVVSIDITNDNGMLRRVVLK